MKRTKNKKEFTVFTCGHVACGNVVHTANTIGYYVMHVARCQFSENEFISTQRQIKWENTHLQQYNQWNRFQFDLITKGKP